MPENVNFNLLIVCSMSCNITVSVSDDFAKEAKDSQRNIIVLNKTTRNFSIVSKRTLCKAMRLQKTYAKSVWLSNQKAKVNLVEQESSRSMFLPMSKMVRLFSFFSMIKRMLQPSKSMLSSNLFKTWDLILNRTYNEAVGL